MRSTHSAMPPGLMSITGARLTIVIRVIEKLGFYKNVDRGKKKQITGVRHTIMIRVIEELGFYKNVDRGKKPKLQVYGTP